MRAGGGRRRCDREDVQPDRQPHVGLDELRRGDDEPVPEPQLAARRGAVRLLRTGSYSEPGERELGGNSYRVDIADLAHYQIRFSDDTG